MSIDVFSHRVPYCCRKMAILAGLRVFAITVLLVCFPMSRTQNSDCIEKCICREDVMTCKGIIPERIPTSIRIVRVSNWTCILPEQAFQHHTWRDVTSLDMSAPNVDIDPPLQITNKTFTKLKALSFLGLHFACGFHSVDNVAVDAFYGLNAITEVDFSNTPRFGFNVLYALFSDMENFKGLKTLTINRFSTVGYQHLTFNESFTDLLAIRGVRKIEATENFIEELYLNPDGLMCKSVESINTRDSTIGQINFKHSFNPCRSLRSLDLSGIRHLPVSDSSMMEYKNQRQTSRDVHIAQQDDVLGDLFVVVNPGSTSIKHDSSRESGCEISLNLKDVAEFFMTQFRYLNYLSADNVNKNHLLLLPCVYKVNVTHPVNLTWENISIQNNDLQIMDSLIVTKYVFNFSSVNLSYNNIKYFGKRVATPFTSIKHLNLSHNNLFNMENGSRQQLEEMLELLINLETVDLSFNQLRSIPSEMFRNARQLKSIVLNNNNLEQFYQKRLIAAEFIDLRANKINSLDGKSRNWFDSMHSKRSPQFKFKVNLDNNPFICTCKNLAFIRWIVASKFLTRTSSGYKCHWEQEYITMDASAYSKIENICKSPEQAKKKVIISTVCVISGLGCVTAVGVFGRRIKRLVTKRRKIKHVLHELETETFRFRYLAYMLETDEDSERAKTSIHLFKQELESTFGFARNLVCTTEPKTIGSRFNEAFELKNNAAVVVAMVTDEFCSCSVSKYVLETAFEEQIPVVVVLVDGSTVDQLQSPVKELTKRSERVQLSCRDGLVDSSPSVRDVCDTLLELAHG